MNLAENIYRLRMQRNMSQVELADDWVYPGNRFPNGKPAPLCPNWTSWSK